MAATAQKAANKRKVNPKAKAKPKAKTKAQAKAAKKPAAKKVAVKAVEQPLMVALRAEHRHMANIMELFKEQLDAIDQGAMVDTHVVYEIMDYMVTWPDRYHHPREDLIYGRVAEVDKSAEDAVDTLQREHDRMAGEGREVLKQIEAWREGGVSGDPVVDLGRKYVADLYSHMNTEEKLVFPRIEKTLTTADWRDLADEDLLKPVTDPIFGGRVDREFRNMARKLRRGIRHSVERGTMVEWIGIEALMESLEVMSMAAESARSTAGDHLRSAMDETVDLFKESPLSAPLRTAANNTRLSISLLGNVLEISRDALDDLSRVNQERRDRVRLMDQNTRR
jgi:hemerythrin-like domain-containing protein